MTDDCMKIRECANNYLSNMSIIDGDATVNKILFELSESDETNLDIKKKTLAEIKNLLDIKQKLKVKNDDIYFLKNLAEQLRNSNKYCLNDNQLSTLLDILKRNF